jgi:hypothetical protein
MSTLSKRLVLRISDDLEAWIGKEAESEGLDNATFVRAVLMRLMNGRAPMLGVAPPQPAMTAQDEPQFRVDPEKPITSIDELLDARIQAAAVAAPFIATPPSVNDLSHELVGAAYPLRRVERSRYNPGRNGYG